MERGEQPPQRDPNKNLEGLFAEHFDELVELFDGMSDATPLSNPELAAEQAKVREFTDKLTGFMLHTEPTPEATQATYFTLQFIYGSYAYASKNTARLVYNNFFEVLGEAQDPVKLTNFAKSHQTVMRLMDRVRPLIDPSGEHVSLTNTMALLTCMAIEKDLNQDEWQNVAAFVEQLENWDGDISELPKPEKFSVDTVDAELLKTVQDVRDYAKAVNEQLATMEPGEERDSFADAVRVELNTAWAKLDMMDAPQTFSGQAIYSELESNFDENGLETYKYTVFVGEASISGSSLGFAYKSMGGEPPKLWYRVYMAGSEAELHPTLEREYSQFAFYDDNCIIGIAEDALANGSSMSETEMNEFNEFEDPEEVSESYWTDAAEILSMCSQGLRRRMNSKTFQAMSHGQQLETIDMFIATATERSAVVDKTAVFEPHHGYVLRSSPDNPHVEVLTRILFGDAGLIGKVKEITVHDIDALLARPIRSRGDRSLTVPGLLVGVELQDAHVLPNDVILKSSEQVFIPLSGQDFDGTFKFIPEQPKDAA